MVSWIKNNKFEAFLLLLVVAVAVGSGLYGNDKGALYEEAKGSYEGYNSTVTRLELMRPYPTTENADAYEGQVDEYEKTVYALEAKMLAYRPDKIESISPPKFIENLNAVRAEVIDAFDAQGVEHPGDQFYLGFKNYTGGLPKEKAAAQLNYQLSAMKAIFEVVSVAKPSALLNVHRAVLAVEKDKAPESVARGRGGRQVAKSGSQGEPPFERLPVEISFVSSEPVMRKIVSDLTSHPDYYFVVRSLRIQNEKRDQSPAKDDVEFDAPDDAGDDAGDPFPGFEDNLPADDAGDPGAAEEPLGVEAPAVPALGAGDKGSRVLGQILGAEQINVLLEIDVLLFKGAKTDGEGEEGRS
jgi:hypothetical protein